MPVARLKDEERSPLCASWNWLCIVQNLDIMTD